VKFDNLLVPGGPNRYIPHMPTDKTQDLSQKKMIFFRTGILGITLDIQNTLFVGHPVKLEFWQK
jgi:hypothetical protein